MENEQEQVDALEADPIPERRIIILSLIFGLAFFVVLIRFYGLMISDGTESTPMAQAPTWDTWYLERKLERKTP